MLNTVSGFFVEPFGFPSLTFTILKQPGVDHSWKPLPGLWMPSPCVGQRVGSQQRMAGAFPGGVDCVSRSKSGSGSCATSSGSSAKYVFSAYFKISEVVGSPASLGGWLPWAWGLVSWQSSGFVVHLPRSCSVILLFFVFYDCMISTLSVFFPVGFVGCLTKAREWSDGSSSLATPGICVERTSAVPWHQRPTCRRLFHEHFSIMVIWQFRNRQHW